MSYSRSVLSSSSRDWDWDWPSHRLVDQHFGVGLHEDDFFSPLYRHGGYPYSAVPRMRTLRTTPHPLLRQPSSGGMSEIRSDSDKFLVLLDVSHFTPEEIVVKTIDDQVVVQANHEEKVDEHGFVSRQFTRRYLLPSNVDPETVKSTLSPEGILTVEAPKKKPQKALDTNERPVPVSVIGGSASQSTTTEIPVQREQKTATTETTEAKNK